ncbi:cytochrome b [Nitrobacter sp.]|uniref:cytochrome b n=1 Tax=Nitrobacter sp. TaxID=29420 RepID=UPI003F64F417
MLTTPTQSSVAHDQRHYDIVSIAFHWLTAVLVVTLFLLAEVWDFLPHGTPLRHSLQGLHISLGILLSATLATRLIWRIWFGRKLSPVISGPPYWVARGAHHLIYALLIGQIALGYIFRWTQGEAFSFFDLFSIPALISPDKAAARLVGDFHNFLGWTIIVLVCGHAVVALLHHYVLRDDTLKRMLPNRAKHSSF